MTEERLKVLLYNSIVMLEEDLRFGNDIKQELGMTEEEYNEIMEG